MRTIDNIAYPLKLEGKSKASGGSAHGELVASFDVKFDLNRYPYELSGGQQQTASIMRALAPNPEVLFLDEPFSALDFEMTLFIREKLQEVFMATGTTMMLVSHDLEEAVYLADEVLLLTKRPTRVAEDTAYDDAQAAHRGHLELGIGRRFPAAALIENEDLILLGIELPPVLGARSAARPTVEEHRGPAIGIAAQLPRQPVTVADLEHARLIGREIGVKSSAARHRHVHQKLNSS